ncbi:MAG: ArsA family ATPase [Actinomycetota bacterium]|nr:ArsA family ATPase [Actinomycetota bacterium]
MSEDLARLIADRHIVVCTGPGGVGKTTISAALAVRAADLGRKTIVCTIDPAKRLAQSLGLSELGNTPREVAKSAYGKGRQPKAALWAMMLDMKRTFDDLIVDMASPDLAKRILSNPFYEHISSTLAGTQEYMAMEKLYELHEEGRWELIIIDTPPSRSALDFLDAPRKITDFLEGRFLRVLLWPYMKAGKGTLRVFNYGAQAFFRAATKITGSELLSDVATFFQMFQGMFGTFKARAERVRELLGTQRTAFIVVASPETESLKEARYFVQRLGREQMPLGGVIVNRTHAVEPIEELDAIKATGDPLLTAAAELYNDWRTASQREDEAVAKALADLPGTSVWRVPDLVDDVHDVAALRTLADALLGPIA